MLGIREGPPLPKNWEKLMGNFDTEIYGDYVICPLTPYKKGVMQIAFVSCKGKLVIRYGRIGRKLGRKLAGDSEWRL